MKQASPILAVHLGALGDFIVALPAIARLGPPGSVEAWGPSPARLSVAAAPRGPIGRVGLLPYALFAPAGSGLAGERELEERLRSFERVVAFARDDGGAFALRVRSLGGALVPPFPSEPRLASEFLVGEVVRRGLARVAGPDSPELHATPGDLDAASRLLREHGVDIDAPFAVVHPGAGGRAKRWPPESFAAAARALGPGLSIVALLGPAELDGPAEPALRLPGVARAVVEDPPLGTLLGILARARLFLGNDGGVAHLAAAAGAPTVAVFGPSDARVWAPRGRGRVAVVEAPEGALARLEPERVVSAARSVLEGV